MYIKFSTIRGGFLRVFISQNCSRNKKRTGEKKKSLKLFTNISKEQFLLPRKAETNQEVQTLQHSF